MRYVAVLLLAGVLLAHPSAASNADWPTLDVYMPDGVTSCTPGTYYSCCRYVGCADVFTPFDVYLVVRNFTSSISALEFSYRIEWPAEVPQPLLMSHQFPPNGASTCDAAANGPLSGYLCIGWPAPLAPSYKVDVVRWTFMITDPATTMKIFLGPAQGERSMFVTSDGQRVALLGARTFDEPAGYVNLNVYTAVMENCGCNAPVVREQSSFGAVKSLYR